MIQMLYYSLRSLGNIVEKGSEWKEGAREWAGVLWNGIFQRSAALVVLSLE